MRKEICIFGKRFRTVRTESALSQWEISVKAGTHLSNVNQVEAGNQEPNVLVALKMLLAAKTDIKLFFTELYSQSSLLIDTSKIPLIPQKKFEVELQDIPLPDNESKLFGILLFHCRSSASLSQNALSSLAQYDHRSLQRVEKGEQSPGIINAIKLVAATGIEVGLFFEVFSKKFQLLEQAQKGYRD